MTTNEIRKVLDAFDRDGWVDYRWHNTTNWIRTNRPTWNFAAQDYRPVQKKPRKWWLNRYHGHSVIHDSLEEAKKGATAADGSTTSRIECVPVVEVLAGEVEAQDEPVQEARFVYVNFYATGHRVWAYLNKEEAEQAAGINRTECVLFYEVMPGEKIP